MHRRLFPKVNAFTYGIYYLALNIRKLNDLPISYNKFSHLSFYDKDHGNCDGSDLETWIKETLNLVHIPFELGEVTLVTMPRVLGYVFNPVSFWLCFDKDSALRAVVCEVHNTFGERHSYICAHPDYRVIESIDVIKGEKLFHVSPFLKREGSYRFKFDYTADKFAAYIDFYDGDDQKQLVTYLSGDLSPLTSRSAITAFWKYPLVTLKAVYLIHWQAFKLVLKKIKYISKPQQKEEKVSYTESLTKN